MGYGTQSALDGTRDPSTKPALRIGFRISINQWTVERIPWAQVKEQDLALGKEAPGEQK